MGEAKDEDGLKLWQRIEEDIDGLVDLSGAVVDLEEWKDLNLFI